MNAKFWTLATVVAFGVACIDKTEEPSDESSPTTEPSDAQPSSDPSQPASEPSFAYITSNWNGSAEVVAGTSYEGQELFDYGANETAGGANSCNMIWTASGTPIENPTECGDCEFAFEMNMTYDAANSVDVNGDCSGLASDFNGDFSYAYGVDAESGSNALFYGGYYGWSAWIVDGSTQADLEGTEHAASATFDGTNFSYNAGRVDFYYYY